MSQVGHAQLCKPLIQNKNHCLTPIFIGTYKQAIAHGSFQRSVTVDLDLLSGADALLDQELGDVPSMVTLELDDVTPLAVSGGRAVAAPGLLEVARQLAHVEVVGQATHRGQTLPRVTLLEVQVDEVVARDTSLLLLLRLCGINVVATSVQEDHIIVFFALFFTVRSRGSWHLFLWLL